MSALKSLASVTRLALFMLGGGLTPALSAQTSTPTTFSAKPNPVATQKAPPPRGSVPGANSLPATTKPSTPTRAKPPSPPISPQTASTTAKRNQVGLVAVGNYFGTGAGLEYLYALFPYLTVGGAVLHTAADLDDDGAGEGASEFIRAQNTAVKAFVNVPFFTYFYAGGGFDLNQVAGEYGWKGSAIKGDKIKTNFSGSLVNLDVKLGSEWQGPWSTYLGVDWIGSSIPVSGKISYDAAEDVTITSLALKGKSPSERLDEETSAQFRLYYLNIRLGMLF